MDLFKSIKLPQGLANATGSTMKFSVGNVGEFEQTYDNQTNLLDEMPSITEHKTEEVDLDLPRVM